LFSFCSSLRIQERRFSFFVINYTNIVVGEEVQVIEQSTFIINVLKHVSSLHEEEKKLKITLFSFVTIPMLFIIDFEIEAS